MTGVSGWVGWDEAYIIVDGDVGEKEKGDTGTVCDGVTWPTGLSQICSVFERI